MVLSTPARSDHLQRPLQYPRFSQDEPELSSLNLTLLTVQHQTHTHTHLYLLMYNTYTVYTTQTIHLLIPNYIYIITNYIYYT